MSWASLGRCRGDDMVEHDLCGFIEGELGALDVVREVGLVERQERASFCILGQGGHRFRGLRLEEGREVGERLDPLGVERLPGGARSQPVRAQSYVVPCI